MSETLKSKKSPRGPLAKGTLLGASAILALGACTGESNTKETARSTCNEAVAEAPIATARGLDAYMRKVGSCMLELKEVAPETSNMERAIQLDNGDKIRFSAPLDNGAEAWTLKVQSPDDKLPVGLGGLILDGTWRGYVSHNIGQKSQTTQSIYGFDSTANLLGDYSESHTRADIVKSWKNLQHETNTQLSLVVKQIS